MLTGDTLFIGDVGRPDLLVASASTADDLAGQLYHSLHEQLLTLPDATQSTRPTAPARRVARTSRPRRRRTIGEQRATTTRWRR